MIRICINERSTSVAPDSTIQELADLHKPGADVLILNGFPVDGQTVVHDGDAVYLIRRGDIPDEAELEQVMSARHTPGVHQRIKSATVGIAGVGGLGSSVAVALARIGIGRLVIADFDVVEPSNLNRQQYFIDQIGICKTVALEANLRRINPYVQVQSHPVMLTPDNIPVIFAGCSILVEAFDRADMKAMLVDTALTSMPDVTIIAASGLAGFGPNNDIVTRNVSSRLYLVGDGISEAQPGSGLMAPRVAIAAGHQANQVLRCLLGEQP